MSHPKLRFEDRRDPKWGYPGDVRENWNNPTIATFFADIMTPGLSQEEVDAGRAVFEGAFEAMLAGLTLPPELEAAGEWREYFAPGCVEEPDAPPCRLHVRVPSKPSSDRLPCVMYYFAAGMGGKPEYFDFEIASYSAALGAVVVAPHYRHQPDSRQPAQLNDAHAAYQWALDNADELGIDPDKIVLSGYSVGGMLALGLAYRLRRYGITCRGVSCVAPPVDDRGLGKSARFSYETENLGWEERQLTWQSFFGPLYAANPAVSPEIVPNHAEVEDLRGFPPVFMHIMDSDPNRDEIMMYCQKLLDADVMLSMHLWPGTNHATFYSGPSYALKDKFYGEGIANISELMNNDLSRPWTAE